MRKILFLLMFAFSVGCAYGQSEVVVAGDNVCLRLYPNESSKWMGANTPHFYTGERLRCVGQTNGYYKVVYHGDYYYLPKRYGRPRGTTHRSTVKPVSFSYIVISGDNVCFRTQPNENSKVMGGQYKHLYTGDYLPCTGIVGNYYQVTYDGGYYYIPKKYGRPRY